MSNFDINIVTRPMKTMRYSTLGDWYDVVKSPDGFKNFLVEVADTKNLDYNFLIGLHELIEYYLCYRRKIKDKTVTGFDIEHSEVEDPGRLKEAPYHKEHMFAEKIEKLMCKELGIEWRKYYNESFDEL
jgi:hypothetical protein